MNVSKRLIGWAACAGLLWAAGAGVAAHASFTVATPDVPNCATGQVRQIGSGKETVLASASAGSIPLSIATRLLLPQGWSARISPKLASAPVQWASGTTWIAALTSAMNGCYTIDWQQRVFEAAVNPAALKKIAAKAAASAEAKTVAAAKVATKPPPATVAKPAPSVWVLTQGSLREQVASWAKSENRMLEWQGPDYTVQERLDLAGPLDQAVAQAVHTVASDATVSTSGSDATRLVVKVAPPPAPRYTLDLVPGSLHDQLAAFASAHAMQFVWLPAHDWLLGASASYAGTREAILTKLAADLNASGVPVVIRYHQANNALVIQGAGD